MSAPIPIEVRIIRGSLVLTDVAFYDPDVQAIVFPPGFPPLRNEDRLEIPRLIVENRGPK